MKKVLKFLLIFLLVLVCIIAAILLFCAIDRKSELGSVPVSYSVYVHTDNAFNAANPLLDLQAADMLFSSPEFVKYRPAFNSIKSSEFRTNPLVKLAAGRAVDFAVYEKNTAGGSGDGGFCAVVNLSYLSFASRLLPVILKFTDIPGLSENETEINSSGDIFKYYQYVSGDTVLYIKPVKNLVIVASSYLLLQTACFNDNERSYTESQLKILNSRGDGNVRIVADASRLAREITSGNEMLSSMTNLLHKDELSVIYFTINDSDISLKCRIPFAFDEENPSSLDGILSRNSTAAGLVSRLGDTVQYYTMISAGTLPELKEALFPFVPKEKNIEATWEKADGYSKMLLGMDLNELLFSWTGSEFAVLGIENQNDPVFVVQIENEEKRQEVFDKINDSMILNSETSLIIGGVRLPQLKLPSFLNWVVSAFNINIPSPYFLVNDGYIYFSESAECLSSVYSSYDAGLDLTKNINWKNVSSQQKKSSAVSLYYNLDRSIPFFLRGKGLVSKVFKLYSMGRFDVRVKDEVIEFQLQAVAAKSGNLHQIPGFPLSLEKSVSPENFLIESGKNPEEIFWVEGEHNLYGLELISMAKYAVEDNEKLMAEAAVTKANSGAVWTVGDKGTVCLYDKKLLMCAGFPVKAGGIPSCRPAATEKGIVIPLEGGKIVFVTPDGSITCNDDLESNTWKSKPAVCGNLVSLYAKGFDGKLFNFEGTKILNENKPFAVDGVGIGSPCLFKNGGKNYTAFITQAGKLALWSGDEMAENFPLQLDGIFLTNVAATSKYIFALSSDAVLYRISLHGKVTAVQIPHATAKNGFIKTTEDGVYVCADANVIYGFKDNLELMNGYPLTGWGKPVFADINGDKIDDVIALTLDKKITAWSLK